MGVTHYYDGDTEKKINPYLQNFFSLIIPGRPTRYIYMGGISGPGGGNEDWKETDEFKEYCKYPIFVRNIVALIKKFKKETPELDRGEDTVEPDTQEGQNEKMTNPGIEKVDVNKELEARYNNCMSTLRSLNGIQNTREFFQIVMKALYSIRDIPDDKKACISDVLKELMKSNTIKKLSNGINVTLIANTGHFDFALTYIAEFCEKRFDNVLYLNDDVDSWLTASQMILDGESEENSNTQYILKYKLDHVDGKAMPYTLAQNIKKQRIARESRKNHYKIGWDQAAQVDHGDR